MFYPIAFYDNEFTPLEKVKFSPTDLGLQRGHSVFDFFKLKKLDNPWMDWYLERLFNSCNKSGLTLTLDKQAIRDKAKELLRHNEVENGCVKVIVTAGQSLNGYTPLGPATVLMVGLPIPERQPAHYKYGAKLITVEYQRDIPEIKTTNYLFAMSKAEEIKSAGAVDVLYHSRGNVSETSRSNFFVIIDGIISTPQKSILGGITRRRLLSLANDEFRFQEQNVTLEDIQLADEVFISSTTKGVLPIGQIDDHIIGNGKVGLITTQLMEIINAF